MNCPKKCKFLKKKKKKTFESKLTSSRHCWLRASQITNRDDDWERHSLIWACLKRLSFKTGVDIWVATWPLNEQVLPRDPHNTNTKLRRIQTTIPTEKKKKSKSVKKKTYYMEWRGTKHYLNKLVIYFGEFSTGWNSLTAYKAPLMAIFPTPTSIASLSSFSLFFSDSLSSVASSCISSMEGLRSRGPPLIHGWLRHWAAVGLFSGAKSSNGRRKSARSFASCSLNSYFSKSTLLRGQKRIRRMCLKSPYLLKKSRE